jgi:hypothetical protein
MSDNEPRKRHGRPTIKRSLADISNRKLMSIYQYVGETRHSPYLQRKIRGLEDGKLAILVDAYTSAYGRKKYWTRGDKTSLRYLSRMGAWLNRILSERGSFKKWAHEQRTTAITRRLPPALQERLFYASTLARSWDEGVSKDAIKASVDKTCDIWMSKRRISSALLDIAAATLKQELPRVTIPVNTEVVLDCKGCLEATIEEGGVVTGIKQVVEQFTDMIGMTPEDYAAMNPLTDYSIIEMAANTTIHPTPLEPVAISEIGNKTRVVTKHPAGELMLNRHITSTWTKILFQHTAVRKLRDDVVFHINPEKGRQTPLLYSADLSQATDYIPHILAQRFARVWMEGYWPGHWMNELVLQSLGPHHLLRSDDPPEVRDDHRFRTPLTTRGIHMGLGSSWTILNLINIVAARLAGAPRGSFRVCGDDLIGFWQPETIQRYETLMDEFGLVVNKSKSFTSPYGGVFCERVVKPVYNNYGKAAYAEVLPPRKLSTVHAARYVFGFRESLIGQLRVLPRSHRLWRSFPAPRLPMEYSGGKGRKPTKKDIREALRRGKRTICLRRFPHEEHKALQTLLRSAGKKNNPNDLPVSRIEPWLLRSLGRLQTYDALLGKIPKLSRNHILGTTKTVSPTEYRRRATRPATGTITKSQRALLWHAPWKALRSKEKWLPEAEVLDFLSRMPAEQATDGTDIDWLTLLKERELPAVMAGAL